MKNTFKTSDPNKVIGINYKSGSATISRALIEQHFPKLHEAYTKHTRWGTGQSFEQGYNHSRCPRADATGKTVLMPFRDPVERFRSACAQLWKEGPFMGLSLEEIIEQAEDPKLKNLHLVPQISFIESFEGANAVKLYRFPEAFDQLALDAGLTLPLPVVNESGPDTPAKPDLTPEQLARVQAIYADDIALFNSITEAGQVYVPPPEPLTDQDVANALSELKSARIAAEQSGFDFNGKHFQTRNDGDIIKITNIGIAAMNPAFQTQFRATDNSWMPMDSATAQAFYTAMLTRGQEIWANYGIKEAQILAATTKDELEAISIIV
jgi:hypothetical protein